MTEFILEGLDLTATFSFCDLKFQMDVDIETAVLTLQNSQQHEVGLRIVHHGDKRYSVGQINPADIGLDEYDLRNIRLFIQDFKIPTSVSVADNMIGRASRVEISAIVRLVQSTLDNDIELVDQTIKDISIMSGERGCKSTLNNDGNVLNLSDYKR